MYYAAEVTRNVIHNTGLSILLDSLCGGSNYTNREVSIRRLLENKLLQIIS